MNVERLVKNGVRQASRQGRHEQKQYGKVARFMVDNAMLDGMKVNSYSEQLSLTEAIKKTLQLGGGMAAKKYYINGLATGVVLTVGLSVILCAKDELEKKIEEEL